MPSSIDSFESVFKGAYKTPYQWREVRFGSVLVATDLEEREARHLLDELARWARGMVAADATWHLRFGDSVRTCERIAAEIEATTPDLVVVQRGLHESDLAARASLGTHVDYLNWGTDLPILLLAEREPGRPLVGERRSTVLAVTDHLAGDGRLVDHAVHASRGGGRLYLCHVEDERIFARYMAAIEKIPEIDTDDARDRLSAQLLKEPRDWIASCERVVAERGLDVTTLALVDFGRPLPSYRALIERHEVDLVVLESRDDNQEAMDGATYALAVELTHVPMLLI